MTLQLELRGQAPAFDGRLVKVTADDHDYEGHLAGIITKSNGAVRVVVEDDRGLLFIHNIDQLERVNK